MGKVVSVRVSKIDSSSRLLYLRASCLTCRKLYGEDDEAGDEDELNKAQADGENGMSYLTPVQSSLARNSAYI